MKVLAEQIQQLYLVGRADELAKVVFGDVCLAQWTVAKTGSSIGCLWPSQRVASTGNSCMHQKRLRKHATR